MKRVLIKLSGKVVPEFLESSEWVSALAELTQNDIQVVLVHGAGVQLSSWSERLGTTPKFYKGQRVSNAETIDVVLAVQAGLINSKLVGKLNAAKICSVGLSGISFGAFQVNRYTEHLGFVGHPVATDGVTHIKTLLENILTPVFSTVSLGKGGDVVNVNADIFAIELALALEIEQIYMVSDVPAVRVLGNEVQNLSYEELTQHIKAGEFTDGMLPKIESILNGLENGRMCVWIGGSFPKQIVKSILTDAEYGTKLKKEGVCA